jgi:hypothetical protein
VSVRIHLISLPSHSSPTPSLTSFSTDEQQASILNSTPIPVESAPSAEMFPSPAPVPAATPIFDACNLSIDDESNEKQESETLNNSVNNSSKEHKEKDDQKEKVKAEKKAAKKLTKEMTICKIILEEMEVKFMQT